MCRPATKHGVHSGSQAPRRAVSELAALLLTKSHKASCAPQRVTALPDAATYRAAVDAMVAAGKYAAAAALCGDGHDTGVFCHYTLPPPPGAPGAIDKCRDITYVRIDIPVVTAGGALMTQQLLTNRPTFLLE